MQVVAALCIQVIPVIPVSDRFAPNIKFLHSCTARRNSKCENKIQNSNTEQKNIENKISIDIDMDMGRDMGMSHTVPL